MGIGQVALYVLSSKALIFVAFLKTEARAKACKLEPRNYKCKGCDSDYFRNSNLQYWKRLRLKRKTFYDIIASNTEEGNVMRKKDGWRPQRDLLASRSYLEHIYDQTLPY